MKSGPAKTPTEILKKRGSRVVEQRGDEITPPAAVPKAPPWMLFTKKKLTGEQKKFNKITSAEWDSKTKQLAAMNILTEWEQTTLAMLCQAIAEYAICCEKIDLKNMVYKTEGGNKCMDPMVGIRNRAHDKLLKLAKEFGMTPAARAGLSVAPKPPMTGGFDAKFFKGPRIHKPRKPNKLKKKKPA